MKNQVIPLLNPLDIIFRKINNEIYSSKLKILSLCFLQQKVLHLDPGIANTIFTTGSEFLWIFTGI